MIPRNILVLVAAGSLAGLFTLAACGGGGGSKLTETDLFTRMIGWYDATGEYYINGELSSSWDRCDTLEPYDTWTMFFEDMDSDAGHPGFQDSSLEYSSDSVRYEWSWEDSPGVVCTEFEEYVFGGQGATFSYESEKVCGGNTWRREITGTRLGAIDTPNDAIREAIPLDLDETVSVSLDPGDWDFFTFTIGATMDIDGIFENFTGSISGLSHDLYYGERWMPSGGWAGPTVPANDHVWHLSGLEANTFYLSLFADGADGCEEAGTFDLTLSESPP